METSFPHRDPKQTAVSAVLILTLTLSAGLMPACLLWIGSALCLLSLFKNVLIQTACLHGIQACITLVLLTKNESLYVAPLLASSPVTSYHLFVTSWLLLSYKNSLNLTLIAKDKASWLLFIFWTGVVALQTLKQEGWQVHNPQILECFPLAIMLFASLKTTAKTILGTLTCACLFSLLSSPSLIQLYSFILPPSATNLIPTDLFFSDKNPKSGIATICVALLLTAHFPYGKIIAATLSLLILPQSSMGGILFAILVWATFLCWNPIAKSSKKAKLSLLAAAGIALPLFCLGAPTIADALGKNLGCTGRVPCSIHLLTSWATINPSFGVNPALLKGFIPQTRNMTSAVFPFGDHQAALYLLSLTKNPTSNNLFVEALLQFGVLGAGFLALFLGVLIFATPITWKNKIILAIPILCVPAYITVGPFSWRELGILWVLPPLISAMAALPRPPRDSQKHSTITQSLLNPNAPLLIGASLLLGLALGGACMKPSKTWRELWGTPNFVTLVPTTNPVWPNNRGAELPSSQIMSAAQSLTLKSHLSRPFLSNMIHTESPLPSITAAEKKQLENLTQIPITPIAGYWAYNPLWKDMIVVFTPFILTALALLNVSLSIQPKIIVITLCLALSSILSLLPSHKSWNTYNIVLSPPQSAQNSSPWKSIWEREVNKISVGETLQFLLKSQNIGSEFIVSKMKTHKNTKLSRPQQRSSRVTLKTTASPLQVQQTINLLIPMRTNISIPPEAKIKDTR